jgi:hypothetical protein
MEKGFTQSSLGWRGCDHFVAFGPILAGENAAMRRTTVRRLLYLIYIIIGVIVAWERGYITVAFLKALLSALLAIILWWLVLLGVSLHIH